MYWLHQLTEGSTSLKAFGPDCDNVVNMNTTTDVQTNDTVQTAQPQAVSPAASTDAFNTGKGHFGADEKQVSYNPLSDVQLAKKSGISVIVGPSENRGQYYAALCVMFVTGSGSDFLAKLVYQFLPTDVSNSVYYWMAWLLTLCAFFICMFAIIKGKESFKKLNLKYFFRICIPALCDVFVSGGRYVALIWVPASIVSVLKNGLQLVFLALIRAMLAQYITKWQIAGISIVSVGLVLCMLQDLLQVSDASTWYGLILMFFVGLTGAIRNSIEEFLLKKDGFHPDFILGLEGIISFTTMLLVGVIFLFSTVDTSQFNLIPNEVSTFFALYPGSIICVVVFMFILVTKKSTQFHVTKLSSAMTRKLFQQFYPIGVWFMALIAYYAIDEKFGEEWNNVQWIRCMGIMLVILGTFVYLNPAYFQNLLLSKSSDFGNIN
mmetsp:Transcript_26118/g.42679  ORF Transcript_26118/g.42679 Transcript_26118/m.42679 type:complete len:434 (+) Transcript_26118:41-1342(+)|eukprot:CAMPEP_0202695338 /NCGR_PEP_ID=MMETSP1385-20130828/8950_1 /ASSEMBLY_ACC=CAM_ASM_000861 /TAXON_ID=933848 /ORGANISM="Elphidium margaritaceum" /LENGTH=433 /DNA_ID=CAMNT_0049351343 /DNA_START=31 /DNA_END=1332 /DNA_ORIENTATION=+